MGLESITKRLKNIKTLNSTLELIETHTAESDERLANIEKLLEPIAQQLEKARAS